jgi:hypothetical protein
MLRRVSLALCLFTLVGCGGSRVAESPASLPNSGLSQAPPVQTVSQIPGQPYPEQAVHNFMEACVAQGGLSSTCTCMVTGIQQNLSFQDYLALEQQSARSGQLTQPIVQIATGCHQQTVAQQAANSQASRQQHDQKFSDEQAQQFANEELARQYVRDSYRNNMKMALASQRGQQRMGEIMMRNLGEMFQQPPYGGSNSSEYPCDYPNQQDSMGRTCGDRAATVRPGGRL